MSRNELVAAFEDARGTPLRRRKVPRLVMRLGSVALRPIHPGLASVLGMGLSLDLRTDAPDDQALQRLGIQARPVSTYIRQLVEAESGEFGPASGSHRLVDAVPPESRSGSQVKGSSV